MAAVTEECDKSLFWLPFLTLFFFVSSVFAPLGYVSPDFCPVWLTLTLSLAVNLTAYSVMSCVADEFSGMLRDMFDFKQLYRTLEKRFSQDEKWESYRHVPRDRQEFTVALYKWILHEFNYTDPFSFEPYRLKDVYKTRDDNFKRKVLERIAEKSGVRLAVADVPDDAFDNLDRFNRVFGPYAVTPSKSSYVNNFAEERRRVVSRRMSIEERYMSEKDVRKGVTDGINGETGLTLCDELPTIAFSGASDFSDRCLRGGAFVEETWFEKIANAKAAMKLFYIHASVLVFFNLIYFVF